MNLLCCQLNPSTKCAGCNAVWCKTCDNDNSWYTGATNHPSYYGGWRCPIAGEVRLVEPNGLRNNICTVGPFK